MTSRIIPINKRTEDVTDYIKGVRNICSSTVVQQLLEKII